MVCGFFVGVQDLRGPDSLGSKIFVQDTPSKHTEKTKKKKTRVYDEGIPLQSFEDVLVFSSLQMSFQLGFS